MIGACNSLERVDPALRRPARFDRQIFIGPPDAAAREDLFRHFLKARPAAENINHEELVKRSDGYSNADIEAIVQEAGKMAAIQDAPAIGQRHLRAALDAVPSSLGISAKRRARQIGFSALSEK